MIKGHAYGRDDATWDALETATATFLYEVARLGNVTTYTELNAVLARRTGLPPFNFDLAEERAALGELLGRVAVAQRDKCNGALLSALVHYLNQNDAGTGFYGLAVMLGMLPKNSGPDAKLVFWSSQLNSLHAQFATKTGAI